MPVPSMHVALKEHSEFFRNAYRRRLKGRFKEKFSSGGTEKATYQNPVYILIAGNKKQAWGPKDSYIFICFQTKGQRKYSR